VRKQGRIGETKKTTKAGFTVRKKNKGEGPKRHKDTKEIETVEREKKSRGKLKGGERIAG